MADHLSLIDRELMAIVRGENDRLMVRLPPRHGKSEFVSRYFPAWYHGHYKRRDIIQSSAVHSLARSFSASARDLLIEHGQQTFGCGVSSKTRAADCWETSEGGVNRAVGVGGSVFGHGAHLFLIDDFHGSHEEAMSEVEREKRHSWFHATASNRLMPGGAIVIVATPYHPDDLMGRLIKEQYHGGDQWRIIDLPAIAGENDALGREPGEPLWPPIEIGDPPTRYGYGIPELERIKDNLYRSGYGWVWDTMYQLDPPATVVSEFDPSYVTGEDVFYDELPPNESIAWRILTLDPSIGETEKADFQAFTLMNVTHEGLMYVDSWMERLDSMKMIDLAIALCRRNRCNVLGIEDVAFQRILQPMMLDRSRRTGFMVPVLGIPSRMEKIMRIRGILTPYLAARNFRFKRHSPGISLLIEQLLGFPNHKFKDGPDSLAMAVSVAEHLFSNGPAGLESDHIDTILQAV